MSSPGRPGPSPASQALPAGCPTCCLLWPPHLGTPETMRAGSLQLERVGPGAWSFPPPHCPLPRLPLLSLVSSQPLPTVCICPTHRTNLRRGGEKPGAWRIHESPLQGLSGHPMSTEKNFLLVLMCLPPPPGLLRCQGKELLPTASQGRRSSRSQVSIWHMMLSELELAPACPGPRVCHAAPAVLAVALLERGLPSSSVLQGHACPCLPAHR